MDNPLYNRDLISVSELTDAEINLILETAAKIKKSPNLDLLKSKLLGSCFFEASTRTRLSFEAAMMRLGGNVIGFPDGKNTSAKKGESLSDAMKVIASYTDALVLRHPSEGAARLAAEVSDKPVINAGDGANRHPTQTLLDLFTIKECQGKLNGLNIAFVGDLKYGRTVHSLAQACARYNARYYFISPEALTMPSHICDVLKRAGIRFSYHENLTDVLDKLDILYMTRLQKERFDEAEFKKLQGHFSLNKEMLGGVKDNFRIMHPLPRVDEIHVDVDDTQHAYYFQQAENGVYTREAILALLLNEELI